MKITLFLSMLLASSFARAGVLSIRVTGIKEIQGDVRVAIYNSKETHLSKKVNFRTEVAPVSSSEVIVKAENIPYGIYTAAAIHDADKNGRLNDFLGVPLEPFGFSNGQGISIRGAPSFEDCKFTFSDDTQVFEIKLK